MEDNQKTYIWDGAVGVRISERTNRSTGETFHNFEFVRCYKTDDSDEMRYSSTFTERNAEALGRVIQKTLAFIDQTHSQETTSQVLGRIEIAKVPADQAVS